MGNIQITSIVFSSLKTFTLVVYKIMASRSINPKTINHLPIFYLFNILIPNLEFKLPSLKRKL